MIGLKQKLNEIIKQRKYITLQEAYNFGTQLGFKQKTVERELNPSRSQDIYTHRNHRGHITGYSYKPSQTQNSAPSEEICPQCNTWLSHSKDCASLVKETNVLF